MNLDTVPNQAQDLITYIAWKKVDILVRKGKEDAMMKKMKTVDTEEQRGNIKTLLIEKYIEFKKNVERVRNQYCEPMCLITLFPETYVFIQMDFAKISNVRHNTKSS